MGAFDELRVDIINVLPKVFCPRRLERRNWIHMTGDLKHTASDRREDFLHVDDDAMVK